MVDLFDGLVIDADNRQYIIKRRAGIDKDGNEIFCDYKYYTTLKGALNRAVELATKKAIKENEVNIKEAAQIYKEAVDKLVALEDNLKQVVVKKGE